MGKERLGVLMIGAPGAGKGTQSAYLNERNDFFHFSSGDAFRTVHGFNPDTYRSHRKLPDNFKQAMYECKDAMRSQAEKMAQGGLLGDELTFFVREHALQLAQNHDYFLIEPRDGSTEHVKPYVPSEMIVGDDGTIRKVSQLKMYGTSQKLSDDIAQTPTYLGGVLFIDLPDSIARERIRARALDSGRPDDASETSIDKRMIAYEEQTIPVLEHLKVSGTGEKIHTIDGQPLPHIVRDNVLAEFEKIKTQNRGRLNDRLF